MTRMIRDQIVALLICGLASCTLVSKPAPLQYGPPSLWRDGRVTLEKLRSYSWKPATDEGLEGDSLSMAAEVVQGLRKEIVENLASCYRLKTEGTVDFWVSFRLASPAATEKASHAGPRLVISVGLPGTDHPAWTSAIEVPPDFATMGHPTETIVHDLLLAFPNGNPRQCR